MKLSRLRGQFCCTTFVIDTCFELTQYYKIDLLIEITFLSKKKIKKNMLFYSTKIPDKLSVNTDHVYCTARMYGLALNERTAKIAQL